MANYSKVQFISWEVHTGPVTTPPPSPGLIMGWINKLFSTGPDPKATPYAGLVNPFHDIEARVAFTKDAISKAAASSAVDKAPTTLKIFMAPEFLFRGTVGAYIHDFINGWGPTPPPGIGTVDPGYKTFPGLFGLLKKAVAVPDYENWIFVFGTAISASWEAPHTQPSVGPSATQSATIYNTALIQAGGAANGNNNYASRKHYTSGIDFVTSRMPDILHMKNIAIGQQTPLIQQTILNNSGDEVGVNEGGATFQLAGIDDKNAKPIAFGVEVCLDHASSSNVGQVPTKTAPSNAYGRIKTAGKTVRLQLVPSGGMSLEAASICLDTTQGSYAFNCDGLTDFADHYGAHTQVWDAKLNPVCQEPAAKPTGTTTVVALDQSLSVSSVDGTGKVMTTWTSKGSDLWNNGGGVAGPGQVRIVPALSL